jgi:heavy metal sensor kinase
MFLSNRIKLPRTLSTRLTLWYAATFMGLLVAALLGMVLAIGSILDNRMAEDLEEDIEEFRHLHADEGPNKVMAELEREIRGNDQQHFFARLIDNQGHLLVNSDLDNWAFLPPTDTLLDLPPDDHELHVELLEPAGHEHASRAAFGRIGRDLYLQIGETMEEKDEIMAVIRKASVVIFCVIIPLASLISWWMAQRAVLAIREVSRAAGDIKRGLLERRAKVQTHGDEIAELAETFNAMAERIRSLIAEMREMTDNIAHDLRSPLARIRAISEVTLSNQGSLADYQKAAADTLEECDRLLQMINMTLDVAEAEACVGNANKEPINLSELVAEACELFEPLAEEKNIRLKVAIDPRHVVEGNKHDLQRMLANLIDNALKYTPANGEVALELKANGSGVTITVSDTGIGIPENEQTRIFERFYRCDQSRSHDGCGLGLSFSRAVARAHGGDITLQSVPMKQSVFTVIIPAS